MFGAVTDWSKRIVSPGLLLLLLLHSSHAFKFTQKVYNATIYENAIGKTYVVPETRMGIDADEVATRDIRYKIISGDDKKFFKVESKLIGDFHFLLIRTRTGNSEVLNRERRDIYRLTIRATVKSSSFKPRGASKRDSKAFTTVVVRVLDTNDLNPLFYQKEYDVSVPEDTPIQHYFIKVAAFDSDYGINSDIYYSLQHPSQQFAIHPTEGGIFLTRPLSYNQHSYHELTVIARDRGAKFRIGDIEQQVRAEVRISVVQVNLHHPEIYLRQHSSLIENSKVDVYAIAKVIDKDRGIHGEIKSVDITNGDPSGFFKIVPALAKDEYNIVLHRNVDRERSPHGFNLTVVAIDKGTPPKQTTKHVIVRVTDLNDQAPVFSQNEYNVDIAEVAPINTPLIIVNASDTDEGRNADIIYDITNGNEQGMFNINVETGLIFSRRRLDAESKNHFTLTVSAQDQASFSTRKQSVATVRITVVDCNDNDPLFDSSIDRVILNENEPVGTKVYHAKATDVDSGDNGYVTYSIANINPVPFAVDHFTGEVRTTQLIDFETSRREYIVKIRASDWGTPHRRQAEMVLTVKLQDINDHRPQFEKLNCKGFLSRRAPVGTEIITVSAIDFDSGNIINYKIMSNDHDGCFKIDKNKGVVTLTCDLTQTKFKDLVINVTATDGEHFADVILSINVKVLGNRKNKNLLNKDAMFECEDVGVTKRLTEILSVAGKNNQPVDGDVLADMPSRFGQNEHSPTFQEQHPKELSINESVPVGSILYEFSAIDKDLGYNGEKVYVISSGNDDSCFKVDTYTGQLSVMAPVDYELRQRYVLNVTAFDLGYPQKDSSVTFKITVNDVNDNAPLFEKSNYRISLPENFPKGTSVKKLKAHDSDSGPNADISYILITDTDDVFVIDKKSGVLTLNENLDRESSSHYELKVKADNSASGDPSMFSTATVDVFVKDINDNPPQFSLKVHSIRIREDIPIGVVVVTVSATDPDQGKGGEVRYSFVSGAANTFNIDTLTGTIRLVRELDFERKQIYNLTVKAKDLGSPSLHSHSYVIVEVIDVNENLHSPLFKQFAVSGSVREGQPIGTFVMQVKATDEDTSPRNKKIYYSIKEGEGVGRFSVDDDGNIHTLQILDRETTKRYWLTIVAQDQAPFTLRSSIEVYVEVIDVNDNIPHTDEPVYYTSIPESSPYDTTVLTLQATDLDDNPDQKLIYKIRSGDPQGFFRINELTGVITTSDRKLDRETGSEHVLEITVADNGNPTLSSTTRVVVNVVDINDQTPVFIERVFRARIPEMSRQEVETLICRVIAEDSDAGRNAEIEYSILLGKDGGRFRIDRTSGIIFSKSSFSVGQNFELSVKASDRGYPQRTATSRVLIDVIATPKSSQNPPKVVDEVQHVDVMENDKVGRMVTLIDSTDDDGDQLWYKIIDGNYADEFMIRPDMGDILIARNLDSEARRRYNLTISVSDGVHTVYTRVFVNVRNINDHRPEFSKLVFYANVSENAPIGTNVIKLEASDEDDDQKLLFAIHYSVVPSSLKKFMIDSKTGLVTTADRLDREVMHEHRLIIIVKDSGPSSKHNFATLHITVLDHNDHAPQFMISMFKSQIHETAEVGTVVSSVKAIDRDTGRNAEIEYSIVSGNVGNVFEIDRAVGDIRLVKQLNKKTMPEYILIVKASDHGHPVQSTSVPVHIIVTIADDAPPRFSKREYAAEVYENQKYGTYIVHVSASSKSSVFYEITDGSDDRTFHLDPNSGVLTTSKPLDYETKKLYALKVKASNLVNKSSTCAILVHILDENDNVPYFLAPVYSGNISESSGIGGIVLSNDSKPLVISATDADSEMNGLLSYQIISSSAQRFFTIDSNTGAIRTTRLLDREQTSFFEFEVLVWDGGKPKLTSETTALVRIDVLDINDTPPVFEYRDYNATLLLPTYKDVSVVQVEAEDRDSLELTTLTYSIIEGNDGEKFEINPQTGSIFVKEEDGLRKRYDLVVGVSDGKFSATTRVHVTVQQTRDSGLKFSKDVYIASIVENSTKIETVALVTVLGTSINEDVKFSILNPSEKFRIGATSGMIKTTGVPFDREKRGTYILVVEVRSKVSLENIRIAHVLVHVSIVDINDNSPTFVNLPYYSVVALKAKRGDFIQKVEAIDADIGVNGEVTYELVRGHEGKFKINSRSGRISLQRRLQHERHNKEFKIVVAATDKGDKPLRSLSLVSIRVINKNMPVFSKQFYSISIPENFVPHSPVMSIMAESPQNRKLIYSIVAGDIYEEFTVDYDTDPRHNHGPCVLYSIDHLDYEKKKLYSLTLRATDSVMGTYAEVPVKISVEDVNDNPPRFSNSSYNISVSESAPFGSSIYKVIATDDDSGINGRIQYHLSGNSSFLFHIDPTEGSIYLKRKLDYEQVSVHQFVVVATDMGTPSLSSEVQTWVYVEDMNDNPPVFEHLSYYCHLSEHAQRNQFITKVLASDVDVSDHSKLHYSIVGGNNQQSFSINSKTGIIKLNNLHKFTEHSSYTLNISVSDGVYTSFTRVMINILNANHHTPHFSRQFYDVLIKENLPSGTTVFTASAKDRDRGIYGQMTYSIQSEASQQMFSINPNTGLVTTKHSLDREEVYLHEVPIVAVDGGGRTGYTLLRVAVGDVNDNAPQFQANEYKASIYANMSVGTTILTVSAIDKDQGASATVEYSLYESRIGSGLSDQFGISASAGDIYLVKPAKSLENQVFQFFVRAKDKGNPSLETDVPVDIIVMGPNDEPPRFERPLYEYFVQENARFGTVITTLHVTSSNAVTYAIVPSTKGKDFEINDEEIFEMDVQGRIVVSGTLDHEDVSTYKITVKAETQSNPPLSSFADIIIQVMDVNDNAPIFESNPYQVSVAENAEEGLTILKVVAQDKDSGDNQDVTYSFDKSSESAANIFSLDSKSGWISTLVKLDRETVSNYTFKVVAKDGGSPQLSSTTTVSIAVRDYNDNPPVFAQRKYVAAVNEDALPGTVITTVETTDADSDESSSVSVEYYITEGDSQGHFAIRKTGEIYVRRPLDREMIDEFSLVVTGTDGTFVSNVEVSIDILDANDNAPICKKTRYEEILSESTDRGTYVLSVEASDADVGRNAETTYKLKGVGVEYFSIDSSQGFVKVSQPLDREQHSKFELVAVVQDAHHHDWSCTSKIEITLTDINDNPPVFTQNTYTVAISEDVKVSTLLTKVHATDADIGINRKIKYSFLDSANNHFSIGSDSGIITLRKELDREITDRYNLTVKATDQGTPNLYSVAAVIIVVRDINDNPPQFEHMTYHAIISERAIPGSAVTRLLATSKDSGVNAEITYSIVNDESGEFSIHAKNGAILVNKRLDYERVREYFLIVQAEDGGSPPLRNHVRVNVSVTDANDNPPNFNQDVYKTVVREDATVGDKVIMTVAGDVDTNENGRITYHIVKGDKHGQFSIDQESGQITVVSELDRESIDKYVLEIQAHDGGVPTMSSSVLVSVEIQDVNDNPPMFSHKNYTAVVQENKPVGSAVLQFHVTDLDEYPNGPPFTFNIVFGNDLDEFRMGENGQLLTAAEFSHKFQSEYFLHVRVYDNGMPPLFTEAVVTIRIIEESQFPPKVQPFSAEVSSYLDSFPGSRIGRVKAVDLDPFDKLKYQIVSNHHHVFTIDEDDGIIVALEGLDVGLYNLNISVTDGKFISYGVVTVTVSLITDDMVKNSVAIRVSNLSPEDFVLMYRRKFLRTLKNVLFVRLRDIEIISIQPAYEDALKQKRQANQDLDVLLAVRRGRNNFYSPSALRRLLTDNKRKIEAGTNLKMKKIMQDRCSANICNNGECIDKLLLDGSVVISVNTDDKSYVSPQHHQRLECNCHPGYGGNYCEVAVNECAKNPCPDYRRCIADTSPIGFRCICQPGKTGALCNRDAANCDGPGCHSEKNPISFRGSSYAHYVLTSNIERHLTLSMHVRTVQLTACLMYTAGQVDYGILEMVNGRIQYKFDCGTGEGIVRVEHTFLNDGKWHEIKLERHGSTAELTIDNKYRESGSAPGHNDVLNVNNDVWFGAEVRPHLTITGYDDIRMGFYGCIDSIKIDHILLPLHITESNAVAALKRFMNVDFQCYTAFDPGICGSQPCLNGGTCNSSKDGKSFTCNCHHRFIGLRCEIDTNPCASNPCLYDGVCHKLDNDYRCECKEGLSGKRCEYGQYCNPNPCRNEGICEEGTNSAICKCRGFQGEYCTMDINECEPHNPCQNGGSCINVVGAFECLCMANATGHICSQLVTTPNITSDSSNIYLDEIIGLVLAILVIVLIVILFAFFMKKVKSNQRHRRNNETVEMTSNEVIKNKTNENCNRISKMSNFQASYPGPPARRVRPASYTPSTQESFTALNNFDTIRSYGSAADELENIPRYSQDFMQSISKPSQNALSHSTNDADHDDFCKPSGASWDANLKDSYPEEKIQNDLKQKKHHPVSDIPPPLQALNNMTVNTTSVNCDDDLQEGKKVDNKGYHWDCSDWNRSQNPLPNITEVSMQEVNDTPSLYSNESNTHVDSSLPLLSSPDGPTPNDRIDVSVNPRLRHSGVHRTGEKTHLLGQVSENSDEEQERPSSPKIFAEPQNFENILNNLEFAEGGDSYRPSSLNYQLHPDEYLPNYNVMSAGPRRHYAGNEQKDDNKYSLPRRRNHLDYDDSQLMVGGYNSRNASCSDVSQNLCEIEDSDNGDDDDDHPLKDTRL